MPENQPINPNAFDIDPKAFNTVSGGGLFLDMRTVAEEIRKANDFRDAFKQADERTRRLFELKSINYKVDDIRIFDSLSYSAVESYRLWAQSKDAENKATLARLALNETYIGLMIKARNPEKGLTLIRPGIREGEKKEWKKTLPAQVRRVGGVIDEVVPEEGALIIRLTGMQKALHAFRYPKVYLFDGQMEATNVAIAVESKKAAEA